MTQITTTPEEKQDWLSRPLLATAAIDWEKAIYIAFITLAILSRFIDLGSRVMSHDESLHTQFSYQFYDGQGFQHTPLMHGPFLFHATAVSYWLFGDNDFTSRIPVALLGVILVAMPYFLRRWLGREGALITSFIFLISPYLTYYARYIRHDMPVIVWAMITFLAIIYYLHQKKDKYLWWLAAGMALMFATKEVAFIYVAIFGSFLIVRLLAKMIASDWIRGALGDLRLPLLVVLLGILMVAAGYAGHVLAAQSATAVPPTPDISTEPFAVDPSAAPETAVAAAANTLDFVMRWIEVAGIGVLSAGLFLMARAIRPHLQNYAEFDLIVLFTSIVLPMASPLLPTIMGWDPRDYSLNVCAIAGQENMSDLALAFARATNGECISAFFSSGLVRSGAFLLVTLFVGVLLGLWWHSRRWIVFAAVFHTIFFVLYTSVFTNMPGWTSGMIGSLGYWLEQHGVQRGSQPLYYYLVVTPLYEFLALIFALLAVRLWSKQQQINRLVGYWLTLILAALLGYSLSNWFFNRLNTPEMEPNTFAGLLVGLLILGGGVLLWIFLIRPSILAETGRRSVWPGVPVNELIGFVPFITWWMILTWLAYSIAGEKMPWLSTHFVIPMGILAGWYVQQKIRDAGGVAALLARPALLLLGLTVVLIVAAFMALGPLLLGQVQFGNLQISSLNQTGRFLGGLLVVGVLIYFWRQIRGQVAPSTGQSIFVLGAFVVLSLLTIRFNYMANFPNADYVTEYMVYAHGAPAAKSVVMKQVDELSMRLNGDKTMQVAFGGRGVAWPFTWYLRDYPNRNYFGDNPTPNLAEYPVVIVGNGDLNVADRVDNILRNTHSYRLHTYLWWPMEDYRRISWNAVFGDPLVPEEQRRGLGNPGVRQALWDIFFYRDYTRYQQVFGGTYTTGQWPLRDDLRLYIRNDALAALWDFGVGAVNAEGLVDPYAEGELLLTPELVINESGVPGALEGELSAPRHVAVGPDGRLYVADAGNHRIQVFEADGTFVTAWGSFGEGPGQFNEPWSVAVDAEFVYVADTWNHRLQKFTLDGDLVGVFGRSGSPADDPASNGLGLFFGPRDVILYGEDQLLVTDTGNHRIQVLDRDGNFLSQTGSQGGALGQLFEPVGMAFGPNGDLFLADTWNGRIQQFTNDLFAYNEWRVNAWSGNSINNKPYLATDRDGRIYVTDPEGSRVIIFNAAGEYLARFGQFGNDVNSLNLPNGIFIDGDDNIYIADANNNRILKFPAIFAPPPQPVEEPPVEEEAMEEPTEETPAEEETIEEPAEESDAVNEETDGEEEETAVDEE